MIIFKCKMCGGDLQIDSQVSVAICQCCGSTMTLPTAVDEKIANLFNRANQYRRGNEFDRALAVYEEILNENNASAEAHWGLELCKYGIEYVRDPKDQTMVPTCHRAQKTSILLDMDYKQAVEFADSAAKSVYENEAKRIDSIHKQIMAISSKEDPYDIFLCYKETSESGSRTKDSVLAQEMFFSLKEQGCRVFFSRITLEDKLGSAYEPYIFAALNSAKVMVVVATKGEYVNSVWTKNEWGRYLALINKGERKVLIPAYRDMDPYDLPAEFSHLQALDMAKLGFVQDLIRGIKKIMDDAEGKQKPSAAGIQGAAMPAQSSEALLKRAHIFLEDGNFMSADEYFERVLDQNPEEARAYWGKLMVERQVRYEEKLVDETNPLENSGNFKRAVNYAGPELSNKYLACNRTILERNKAEAKRRQQQQEENEKKMRLEAEEKKKKRIELLREQAVHCQNSGSYYSELQAINALITLGEMDLDARQKQLQMKVNETAKKAGKMSLMILAIFLVSFFSMPWYQKILPGIFAVLITFLSAAAVVILLFNFSQVKKSVTSFAQKRKSFFLRIDTRMRDFFRKFFKKNLRKLLLLVFLILVLLALKALWPLVMAWVEERAWKSAMEKGTLQSYQEYKLDYPQGQFAEKAQQAVAALSDEEKLKQENLQQMQEESSQREVDYQQLLTQAREAMARSDYLVAEELLKQALSIQDNEEAKSMLSQIEQSPAKQFLSSYPLVDVPAGEYMMGSVRGDERPAHRVELTSFKMGKMEVSQAVWAAILGSNPAKFKNGDNHPVENVSWNDVQVFLGKIKEKTGLVFRLPSEAEWEYACRAGTTADVYGDLDYIAWHDDNSKKSTHPVGAKQANAYGLYDMLGNVSEWCSDWYQDDFYKQSSSFNPVGPLTGSKRVIRGGNWDTSAGRIRASYRDRESADERNGKLGFRLVMVSE